MSSTKIFFVIVLLLTSWATKTCYRPATTTTKTSADFFQSPQFKGNYFKTLDLWSADSVVQHIKAEVPAPWQGIACEGLYYNLPKEMPDSLLLKQLDAFEKAFPHDTILVFTKGLRGRLLFTQSRFDTALVCLTESAALAKKTNSIKRTADAEYYLGTLHSRQGNYPEAIKRLQEAHNAYALLPESLGNGQLFETMMSLGNAYRRAKDYTFAQIWHQQAWDMARNYEWAKGFKIQSAAAVARDYLSLHQLDSAKIMIDTAFYYQNLYQNNYNEAICCYILGQIEVAQGNCAAGLRHLQKAQQTNLAKEDMAIIQRYNEGIADAYLCLGHLDSALTLYQKALTTPDKASQVRIYEQVGKVYAQSNNLSLAYTYGVRGKRLSDSLFTLEKDKEMGRLQAKKDLDNRTQVVEAAAQRIKINRLIIVGFLSVLSMALVMIAFWGYRKKQGERLAQQEKERIAAREALKTQALAQVEQALAINEKTLEQTEQALATKETALSISTEQLNLKSVLVQELEMKLTVQSWGEAPSVSEPFKKEKLQNLKILTTDDWLKFRQLFNQYQPNFIAQLTARFPNLTTAEMRLVLLIQLGFDVSETANVLGIETASVYRGRHRLRKKMDLEESVDLEGFIERL